MALNAKLVVVGGEVKTEEIKLRLPSTIGRGRGTSIMLPHPLVSRQHCELFEADGQLMVRDLGSLNGTFVNNQKITEAPLPPGELLTIGTVTFRAVYDSQADAGPPAGPGPKLKSSGQTVSASAETMRTPAKKPAESESDEVLEFDFDKPLIPPDEDDVPSGPGHSTRKVPTQPAAASPKSPQKPAEKKPAEQKPAAAKAPAKTEPAPAAKAKPAKPASPAPGGKPSRPGDAATIDYKRPPAPADDEDVTGGDDDDLDDFLKSLEK